VAEARRRAGFEVAPRTTEEINRPVVSVVETGNESLGTAHVRAPERKPVLEGLVFVLDRRWSRGRLAGLIGAAVPEVA
jgi:hypothetical protein